MNTAPAAPLYPLRFAPIFQYRLWGGRNLAAWVGCALPGDGPIGEAWLLSDRTDYPSRVADGPLKGCTIAQLIARAPVAMLGILADRFRRFPLLLKFLDVQKMLSVQVHPRDDQTALIPPGDTGKTEAWVVLEASARARIYAGLKPGATSADLRTLRAQARAMKSLIVFDLDGTLAESKSPLDAEMVTLFGSLLAIVRVAIISGGAWPQYQAQVLGQLAGGDRLDNLSLLPTCGTRFYERKDSDWYSLYAEDFTAADARRIVAALNAALDQSGFRPAKTWGDIIEDRGSQITLSALGQHAPLDVKKAWDPDFKKRERIKAMLDPTLPGFSIHLGGATSIDITRPGIDKAYGIAKLYDILGVAIADMLFVGDALFPGGNDYPARQAGVLSVAVRDPQETKRVIETILACQS